MSIRSSYAQNNYGDVLKSYVTAFRPALAVELGVLDGYSTVSILRGIARNKQTVGLQCQLHVYDLFEDYPFKHSVEEEVSKYILERATELGVADLVRIVKTDAFKVHTQYENGTVHFLHVDLSNTGDILRQIMTDWHPKMVIGGIIAFEGGSEERDKVEWMLKFNKTPIKPEVESNPIINKLYKYATHIKYPSLTVMLKRDN